MIAVQAIYYLLTGLWPLVSIETFELVTGPKTDEWLVQTVGLLLAVVAITLLAGTRNSLRQTRLLAGGIALAIGGIDVYVVVTGQAPSIYLADAAIEAVFLAAVVWAHAREPRLAWCSH